MEYYCKNLLTCLIYTKCENKTIDEFIEEIDDISGDDSIGDYEASECDWIVIFTVLARRKDISTILKLLNTCSHFKYVTNLSNGRFTKQESRANEYDHVHYYVATWLIFNIRNNAFTYPVTLDQLFEVVNRPIVEEAEGIKAPSSRRIAYIKQWLESARETPYKLFYEIMADLHEQYPHVTGAELIDMMKKTAKEFKEYDVTVDEDEEDEEDDFEF